jgi:hypothetical protein
MDGLLSTRSLGSFRHLVPLLAKAQLIGKQQLSSGVLERAGLPNCSAYVITVSSADIQREVVG